MGTVDDSIAQNSLTVPPTAWMGQLADSLPLTDPPPPYHVQLGIRPQRARPAAFWRFVRERGGPTGNVVFCGVRGHPVAIADGVAEAAGGERLP